ncbi:MAG: hypothetical protein ACN6I6_00315 [bacterium]
MTKHIGLNADKNYMKMLAFIIFSLFLSSCGDEMRLRRSSSSGSSNALAIQDCPALFKPVCAQPPMPACPQGTFCAQVMPALITYDNECQMEKAGASFISEGNCP